MYDLPSEHPEDPGLPDEFHIWQAELCSATFNPSTYPVEQVLVATDLNLYYDPDHTGWHKRPDWFAVVGGSRFYQGETGEDLRLSYVIWHEKIAPIVVIEFLSPSTRADDLGKRVRKGEQPTKWQVYEQILKIPYYVTFDRRKNELRVFCLVNDRYQEQVLTNSKFWFPELQMGLGLWRGKFRGMTRQWLRWYDVNGEWIPTEAEQERLRAEQEQQRAEQERLRAEQTQQELEQERLRAEQTQQELEQERLRTEQTQQELEQERLRTEQTQQELEQERLRVERLAERLRQLNIDPNLL
jgi:Uma2 family endonuclease